MQVEQNNLRLIACPHILSVEKGRLDVLRPAGATVHDLLRSIGWMPEGLSARVFIDGVFVQNAAWEYTTPQAGQAVIVRAIPMGGGGGGEGKQAGQIAAMIAIMVIAVVAQQYWAIPLAAATGMSAMAASAVIVTTVSIAGTLALTCLVPKPLPRRALPQPVREWDLQEVA